MFNYIVKAWIEIEYAAGREDLSLYTFDMDWRLDDTVRTVNLHSYIYDCSLVPI